MKLNLLINLPQGFVQDARFNKYFNYFSEKYNVKHTNHSTIDQFKPDLAWADAIIMWTFPEFSVDDFKQNPNIRYVAKLNSTKATVLAAQEAGVPLSDMRNSYSLSVAEFAVGQILNIYRNIGGHVQAMRDGTEKWVVNAPLDFPSEERELSSSTVGIVGFGGIGRHIARFLRPFMCKIRVSDPFVCNEVLAEYGVERAELAEVFASDVIISCAANNSGTEKLVSRELINSIKSRALYINVGRAHIVDNEALLERIRKHDINVALDVFEVEPLPKEHELRTHKNVYLSPHVGGTLDSFLKIFANIVEEMERVLERGESPKFGVGASEINSLRDYK